MCLESRIKFSLRFVHINFRSHFAYSIALLHAHTYTHHLWNRWTDLMGVIKIFNVNWHLVAAKIMAHLGIPKQRRFHFRFPMNYQNICQHCSAPLRPLSHTLFPPMCLFAYVIRKYWILWILYAYYGALLSHTSLGSNTPHSYANAQANSKISENIEQFSREIQTKKTAWQEYDKMNAFNK